MRHEERPKGISEAVHAASFPVYGLVDNLIDFSVIRYGLGISHLSNLIHISLTFSYPPQPTSYPNSSDPGRTKSFQIISIDAAVQNPEREHIFFSLDDPYFSSTGALEEYHFSEEEQKQAGSPFTWDKILTLSNTSFSGTILHWKMPIQSSVFLLKSEKTILMGHAYGLSDNEFMQTLSHLQIINDKDDLLKQYQQEPKN